MPTWVEEVNKQSHDYVRRGGKKSRTIQIARMNEFLSFTASKEDFKQLNRLGKRHVINFWKAHRYYSRTTAYRYWLAIRLLWGWMGRKDYPPMPNIFSETETGNIESTKRLSDNNISARISSVIKKARVSKNLSINQVANMSGCEMVMIQAVEQGSGEVDMKDLQSLFDILEIRLIID